MRKRGANVLSLYSTLMQLDERVHLVLLSHNLTSVEYCGQCKRVLSL